MEEPMMRNLLRWLTVAGVLFSLANLQQRAAAQPLREPTIDERFRDGADQAPNVERTLLNRPQSKPTRDKAPPAPAPSTYFGVTFNTDNRDAILTAVAPGSPAEQAGLQPNDVMETLQGKPVRSYQDVFDIVAKMRPGEMLDIGFSRRVNVHTQATLAPAPTATTRTAGYPPDSEVATSKAPEDVEMAPQSGRSRWDNSNSGSQTFGNSRRNEYQNNGQLQNNRRFFGRGLWGRR